MERIEEISDILVGFWGKPVKKKIGLMFDWMLYNFMCAIVICYYRDSSLIFNPQLLCSISLVPIVAFSFWQEGLVQTGIVQIKN